MTFPPVLCLAASTHQSKCFVSNCRVFLFKSLHCAFHYFGLQFCEFRSGSHGSTRRLRLQTHQSTLLRFLLSSGLLHLGLCMRITLFFCFSADCIGNIDCAYLFLTRTFHNISIEFMHVNTQFTLPDSSPTHFSTFSVFQSILFNQSIPKMDAFSISRKSFTLKTENLVLQFVTLLSNGSSLSLSLFL